MEKVTVERLDHLGVISGVIKDLGLIEMIDSRIIPDEREEIRTRGSGGRDDSKRPGFFRSADDAHSPVF